MGHYSLGSSKANSGLLTLEELYLLVDKDLVKAATTLQRNLKHMNLENEIYEHFFEENDPSCLLIAEKFSRYVEHSRTMAGVSEPAESLKPGTLKYAEMLRPKKKSTSASQITLISKLDESFTSASQDPRLTFHEKMELVSREKECIQREMEKFKKRTTSNINECLVAMEVFQFELEDSISTRNELDDLIMARLSCYHIDVKLPAERFIKFMDDWNRRASVLLERLRIKVQNQSINLKKLRERYDMKVPLHSNVNEVDLYMLEVQQVHFKEQLKSKSDCWIETKNILSKSTWQISEMKKKVTQQTELQDRTLAELEKTKVATDRYETEEEELIDQIGSISRKHDHINHLILNYRCPSIEEYLKSQCTLESLIQQRKRWTVRKGIQENAFKCYRTILRRCKVKNKKSQLLDIQKFRAFDYEEVED